MFAVGNLWMQNVYFFLIEPIKQEMLLQFIFLYEQYYTLKYLKIRNV